METKYLTSGYVRKYENKYIFLYHAGGRHFQRTSLESFHVRCNLITRLLITRVALL
jgi:hypothetical protein